MNGGNAIYNVYFVSIFDELLSKIFLYRKKVPKKIIAKKGKVIDNTEYME